MSKNPLVFDLDGTVIKADSTIELCLLFLKIRPVTGIFKMIIWLMSGKGVLKHFLGKECGHLIRVDSLPYRDDLLKDEIVNNAQTIALISGGDDRSVKMVAEHLGVFDFAQGSSQEKNLISGNKLQFIQEKYQTGFDYVGDSFADIPVWQAAENAYGVNVSQALERKAKQEGINLRILSHRASLVQEIFKSMRVHQWAKNILLVAVALLNIAFFQWSWIVSLTAGFIAFGFVASATYFLNDLLDVQEDRIHPTKHRRPIASGALDMRIAVLVMLVMGIGGLLLGFITNFLFGALLFGYMMISISYSVWLKKLVIIDSIILGLLFCWRILAGGILVSAEANAWFLIAVGFFFFGLALGKRGIELRKKRTSNALEPGEHINELIAGRGYKLDDLPVVVAMGIAGGISSTIIVLIYALLSDTTILDHAVSAVATATLLLYWIGRFWILIGRNQVNDDPVIFALKDRVSIATLSIIGGIIFLEQLI